MARIVSSRAPTGKRGARAWVSFPLPRGYESRVSGNEREQTRRNDDGTAGPPPHAPPSVDIGSEIDAQRVAYLVRQAPTGFFLGALAIAAIIIVLWDAAPRRLLLAWFVASGLLSLPAMVVVWRFGRAQDVSERLASWRRALIVSYALAGAGWGAAGVMLYPSVTTPYQVFLLFVTGAAAVSGMAGLAPVRAAFMAYVSGSLLPITAVLLLEGTLSSIATGVLILAFLATTTSLATILRGHLVTSLRLRYENLGLIADLSRAKDDAEAASRAKSVLLANVSHELRTPLTLILGPTRRLLRVDAGGEAARRDLETVELSAQALLKHVSDLLDVAKLDAGRMEIQRSPIDLAELVRRTASLFEIVAAERRVELTVETPASLPTSADASKLERVLLNLISNAMKFVPDGGHVRVRLHIEGPNVALSVEDDGAGVPLASRAAIFERFRRGDEFTARRFGGTGLGLSIAKEIVERHGGRIDVTDGAAGGALFRVTLPDGLPASALQSAPSDPAAREALAEVARQTVAELRPPREPTIAIHGDGDRGLVLVIEDNVEMSRFLVDCLMPDLRVATASDGRHGVEQALALKPDLILTDLLMPALSGDALVRELRAHPELEGVPILVLTAKADDELRVRMLREGVQDFLTKPVSAEELRARVANFVMLKRTRDVLQAALSTRSRDVTTMADQLAAANRAKDEFLAVLSHELRTPLMPILAWASLLRERKLDPQTIDRGLAAIERSAKLETRIVDDLLDVSRAITGKLQLDMQPTALGSVIQGAMESVRPAADAKRIILDAVSAPDADLVSGDPDRLQQVVWNLLSNAIKFTPRGGRVEVRVARVGEHVRLTVRDDGTGIDPAVLPRLFERFWQADSSSTRTHGGLGIGLAVVRHLVELHGGTVRADSAGKGRGAIFTVTLPAMALPDARGDADPAPITASLHGLKVMVVDDDLDTCDTIGAVLESAGAEVRTCASAQDALRVMDDWVPDLLVSDLAMPGDDGFALIRRVRERRADEGGRMVAVALTAYGRSEDRARALSAGFQMHLRKPIAPSHLVNVVANATGHRTRH
jgi:signal transduction histidine kinase